MPDARLNELFSLLFQAHPWHGISPGADAPEVVTAYIELVPTDAVKFELDKPTGHLRVDRPQKYSSLCPTLYGFVPQTFCDVEVAQRCAERTPHQNVKGDGDPLDICVLSERTFPSGGFLTRARPIGGLRLVDHDEADDKIIAVLEGDLSYGGFEDIGHCPRALLERVEHYFLSYKELPGVTPRKVEIAEIYGRDEAQEVIRRSQRDYVTRYGAPGARVEELRALLSR